MRKKTIKHFGERCVGPTISNEQLRNLHRKLTQQKDLRNFLTIFQLLGGETRIQILYLLHQQKELCVCDLAEIIHTTVSAVSHQLRLLREADLVKTRRDNQTIYYFLTPSHKLLRILKHYFL